MWVGSRRYLSLSIPIPINSYSLALASEKLIPLYSYFYRSASMPHYFWEYLFGVVGNRLGFGHLYEFLNV